MTAHPTLTSGAIFLCLLAACLCCVVGVKRRLVFVLLPVAFMTTLGTFQSELAITHIGVVIIAAAVALLIWRDNEYIRLSCAGVFAALAVNVFTAHGVTPIMAGGIALALPVCVALMTLGFQRTRIRPEYNETALALVTVAAVIIWAGPSVIDGWYAARALNISFTENETQSAFPVWAFGFVGLAFIAGIIKGMVFKK